MQNQIDEINELKNKLQEFEDLVQKINGVNLILRDNEDRILVQKCTYKELPWMLPGGKIERGETPEHAAISELEEEAGLICNEENLVLLGFLQQRIPKVMWTGTLFLFESRDFVGTLKTVADNEILERKFMSYDEIFSSSKVFSLGYIRIIARLYLQEKTGIKSFSGRLRDPVSIPWNGFTTF